MRKTGIPYGIKHGQVVHISKVESGLACDCYCPGCNARLVAKKGNKVTHHFSHYNVDECHGAYETAMHFAAKNIVASAGYIALPSTEDVVNYKIYRKVVKTQEQKIKFNSCAVESHSNGFIPDVSAETSKGIFWIEIFVTHKCEPEKILFCSQRGISLLEIDLSNTEADLSDENFRSLVVDCFSNKYFLHDERLVTEKAKCMSDMVEQYKKYLLSKSKVDDEEDKRIAIKAKMEQVMRSPHKKFNWNAFLKGH